MGMISLGILWVLMSGTRYDYIHIMQMLPREVDSMIFNISIEDPGQVSFSSIGGLSEKIRELREVCGKYSVLF